MNDHICLAELGEWSRGLDALTPYMNRLSKRALFQRLQYDLMSDAIYWADEYPWEAPSGLRMTILRVLLRYRTSVIIEQPEVVYIPVHDAALEKFPNWVGFHEARWKPSTRLKKAYRKFERAMLANLAELERDLDIEAG